MPYPPQLSVGPTPHSSKGYLNKEDARKLEKIQKTYLKRTLGDIYNITLFKCVDSRLYLRQDRAYMFVLGQKMYETSWNYSTTSKKYENCFYSPHFLDTVNVFLNSS